MCKSLVNERQTSNMSGNIKQINESLNAEYKRRQAEKLNHPKKENVTVLRHAGVTHGEWEAKQRLARTGVA